MGWRGSTEIFHWLRKKQSYKVFVVSRLKISVKKTSKNKDAYQ